MDRVADAASPRSSEVPQHAKVATIGRWRHLLPIAATIRRAGPSVAGMLIVVGMLEFLARTNVINSVAFPPISEALTRLAELLMDGTALSLAADTLQGWAFGMAICLAVGVPLGIAIGSSQVLYRSLRGVIEFLRPIPPVALIPLSIIVYGTGIESKVFLVVFAAFWPLFIQSIYGVQDVDPVALDTARAYGIGRWRRLVWVTLPSAAPYIATGVRISSTIALILSVTAELVIGAPGLGREIQAARDAGAYPEMYALIIATGLLGVLLNGGVDGINRRVLRWHPTYRTRNA